MNITINGTTYGVEGDHYDGDILLLSAEQDVTIEGGYIELKESAIAEHGYFDKVSGDIECEEEDIKYFIQFNIAAYIRQNFEKGLVTVNA